MRMTIERGKNVFSLSRVLFYLFCLVLFYLAFRYVGNLEKIGRLFLSMSPFWMLLALATQIATYFWYALVLKVLLHPSSSSTGFLMLSRLSLVSIFLNQSIPSGGLSGSSYIFKRLRAEGIDGSTAISVLIIECLCYYTAFVLLITCALLACLSSSDPAPGRPEIYTYVIGVVFYLVLSALLIILGNPKVIGRLRRILRYIPSLLRFFDRFVAQMDDSRSNSGILPVAMKNYKTSLMAVFFQCMVILSDVVSVFALLKGFGEEIPFQSLIFAVMLSMVIGALPITPGGLLTFESAMTFFLVSTGLPLHLSLTITMLFRFLSFWLPMPIGIILYRNLQRRQTGPIQNPNKVMP